MTAAPHRQPAQAAERYAAIRAQTRALAEPLSEEDCALQSMPDASPVKWHLAHTTWFFETFVLLPHRPGYRERDSSYRVLFNSYYHGVGAQHPRPERGLISRPALSEVLEYRRHVDEALAALLSEGKLETPASFLVELGLQHEQQHQELILTDVKHLLWCNPRWPAYRKQWPLAAARAPQPRWIGFEEGLFEIGHDGAGFCFDNEAPRHRVWLDAFELASHPVTQGDFINFIEDDGYRRPELWLAAGWDAAQAGGWQAPLYWEWRDGRWHEFTLHGDAAVDPSVPLCHVSFYEAEAFARWAGARLPTEAEWEVGAQRMLLQATGEVWEWTRSDYSPYPRFRPAAGAVGEYNGKFMSGQYVLRGGSCATPQGHIRATYRNFFQPDKRWQFSGVRLARDLT